MKHRVGIKKNQEPEPKALLEVDTWTFVQEIAGYLDFCTREMYRRWIL